MTRPIDADRRTFLRSATALGAAGLAGCFGSAGEDGDDESQDGGNRTEGTDGSAPEAPPRLSTDGKWVVDEDGNEVVLRGVNLVEPRFADLLGEHRGGDHETTLELALSESAGWFNRVLRLPVTQWGIDEEGGLESYFEAYVDPTVDRCREAGTYLILDYHLIEDWDDESVQADVEAFWDVAAPRYADEPHVVYNPFNEPNRPREDSLENWEAFAEVFQPWIDSIREDAPETPIVVSSPRLTSLTKYAAERPLEGGDLIYDAHIYPGEGDSPEDWDPEYGDVADEVPVIVTEWGFDGTDDVQPGTTEWGRSFREWLSGKENVGWTAWCFDSHWAPAMFDQDLNLRGGEMFHGWFVKEWLFDARNDRVPETLQSGADATFEGPPEDVEGPAVPTNLELDPADDGTATLSWTHRVRDGVMTAYYDVYVNDERRAQPDLVTLVNEQADGDFTRDEYTFETELTAFTPGQSYDVYVEAVDSLSQSSDPSRFVTYDPEGELEVHAGLPRVESAPAVDGEVDGVWDDVPARPLEHVPVGEVSDPSNLAAEWRGCWDDEALYVLLDVTDDARSVDDGDPAYQNDSAELFVDADNSKRAEYDGENDFQLIFERETGRIAEGVIPRDPAPVDHAQAETGDGWRLEVALPWSFLGVDAGAGHLLGFDAHVNDDDDGGDRDAKVTWFDAEDSAWQNPSVLANVELTD